VVAFTRKGKGPIADIAGTREPINISKKNVFADIKANYCGEGSKKKAVIDARLLKQCK